MEYPLMNNEQLQYDDYILPKLKHVESRIIPKTKK